MKPLTRKEKSKIKIQISKLRNHRFAMMDSLILISLLGMLTPVSVPAAESWKEFTVWPTTDDQELPDIDGDIVVWQQFVAEYGDYDIYVADLSTTLKTGMNNPDEPLVVIIGDANDQMRPAVFENTVVWQDYVFWQGSGDWDISGSDISDRDQPVIFAVSNIFDNDEQSPAIHGNIVLWPDIRRRHDRFGKPCGICRGRFRRRPADARRLSKYGRLAGFLLRG